MTTFAAVIVDPADPGRKELGYGDTYFVIPAWAELNQIAGYVRRGLSVREAYARVGLAHLAPPEGMLACIAEKMATRYAMPEGYARDHRLQAACADCWELWIAGPPSEWYVTADRIDLRIGVTLPSRNYQGVILRHVRQGVPLRRAYYYAGQEDILPDHLVECMDPVIRGGADMTEAATFCHDEWMAAQAGPTPGLPVTPVERPPEEPPEEKRTPAWLVPAAIAGLMGFFIATRRGR